MLFSLTVSDCADVILLDIPATANELLMNGKFIAR